MSDDIPRTRRQQAEQAAADTEAVPAGGKGADTGAVSGARIDEGDTADVQNISSQNDIAGVGTRAADGSIEHSDTPDTISPHGRRTTPPRGSAPDGAPDSLAARHEPAVDPEYAAKSRSAGPAASAGDPGDVEDAAPSRTAKVADRVGSRWALLPAAVVGVIAVVLFAVNVPAAPAIAWIGIALQVALFVSLAVSAAALRPGRYRRLSVTLFTAAMVVAAVLFGILLLTIGLAPIEP